MSAQGPLSSLAYKTISEAILAPLSDPALAKGRAIITYDRAAHQPDRLGFPELAERSMRAAHALHQRGVRRGDVVLVGVDACAEFPALFCGLVLLGALPCVVPPVQPGHAGRGARNALARLRAKTSAVMLIGAQESLKVLESDPVLAGLQVATPRELRDEGQATTSVIAAVGAAAPLFLQPTSGSTGDPKVAAISHANLVASIRGMCATGRGDPSKDVGVSWLPMFHDMGLISLLTAIYFHGQIVIQPSLNFLRDPMDWLRKISEYRGTVSAAPNFALGYCVRRYRRAALAGVDLGCWRCLVVGAERVDHSTLKSFAECFAPHGFSPDAFFPSYGTAETTLAITMPAAPTAGSWGRYIHGDRRLNAVRTANMAPVGYLAHESLPGEPVLSMGRPIPGVDVGICDHDATALPDDVAGQIRVRGPTVMIGYYEDAEHTAAVIREGWFYTGDIGYICEGELFVLGRIKELIILRGRNFYPHEFEDCLAAHPSVGKDRSIAFGIFDKQAGTEKLIVVIEPALFRELGELRAQVQERLRAQFGFGASEVLFVRRGSLPRTSSNKLQRAQCRNQYGSQLLATINERPTQAFA